MSLLLLWGGGGAVEPGTYDLAKPRPERTVTAYIYNGATLMGTWVDFLNDPTFSARTSTTAEQESVEFWLPRALGDADEENDRLPGGLGLANVRARLAALHPEAHRIEIEEGDGRVRVTVELPARFRAEVAT